MDHYSEAQLLVAYRRVKAAGSHIDPARSFHLELKRLEGRLADGPAIRRLAAIRIERRAVAVAILEGEHLAAPPQVRQLSSNSDKALGSAASFISRILEKYPVGTAALETIPRGAEVLRGDLMEIISHVLVEQGIGIWEIPKQSSPQGHILDLARRQRQLWSSANQGRSGARPLLPSRTPL